jgi:L-rhamnose mutarotase
VPDSPENKVQRICFTLQVKPSRIEEYKARHNNVWPEMRQALGEAGWHNYSLFLRDDGLLVGYVETTDFPRALERMAANDVNSRWQAEMAGFFEGVPGRKADEQIVPLAQVFYLP